MASMVCKCDLESLKTFGSQQRAFVDCTQPLPDKTLSERNLIVTKVANKTDNYAAQIGTESR